MDKALGFLNQNWVGVLLAIIALMYALYEGLKRRGPRLAYQYLGQRIIGQSVDILPDKLEINYDGHPVRNLSLTRIALWNKGPSALRGADIPEGDPISISFEENSKILRVEISKITRDINNISIVTSEENEKSIAIFNFEFLDSGDGALLSIWHTAEKTAPIIEGTIIGQKDGVESFGRFMWRGREPTKDGASIFDRSLRLTESIIGSPYMMAIFVIVMGIVLIISITYEYYTGHRILESEPRSEFEKFWVPILLGCANILAGVWSARRWWRKFPKNLLPEDYSSREEKLTSEPIPNSIS